MLVGKLWRIALKDNTKNISYWKDIVFQASGNTVAQLIGILGLPILARLYAPESFADQAIFIQLTALLVAFVTFRFEYFIPILKNEEDSRILSGWIARLGLIMCVIFTVAVYILDWFSKNYFSFIMIEYYYYLVPVTAYLISLSFLYQHEAQRSSQYKLSGVAEVVSKVSYVGSGIAGSFFSTGLALILTSAFGAIGKIFAVRKFVLFKNSFNDRQKQLVRVYRGRATGMIIANTLLACSSLIPLYVIGLMYGSATLGQFSLVMATIFLPSGLIGAAVGSVFYQRAGQLWNEQKIDDLKQLWAQTLVKLMVIALPIYVFVFFMAPWAYPFVFGSVWVEAGSYAKIMTLAAFFSFIAGPFDRLSLVLGLAYFLPFVHVLRLLVIAVISFVTVELDFAADKYLLGFSLAMSSIYIFDLILCRLLLGFKAKFYEF